MKANMPQRNVIVKILLRHYTRCADYADSAEERGQWRIVEAVQGVKVVQIVQVARKGKSG